MRKPKKEKSTSFSVRDFHPIKRLPYYCETLIFNYYGQFNLDICNYLFIYLHINVMISQTYIYIYIFIYLFLKFFYLTLRFDQ